MPLFLSLLPNFRPTVCIGEVRGNSLFVCPVLMIIRKRKVESYRLSLNVNGPAPTKPAILLMMKLHCQAPYFANALLSAGGQTLEG